MAKLKDFIKFTENEVKRGSIYVWGGQGQKATEALIDKLETSVNNKKRAKALLKKRKASGYTDVRAYDCSGLICKALEVAGVYKAGFDTTAQGLRKTYCTQIGRDELLPGDLVFRKNLTKTYHVGVVVDTALNVVEAYGRDRGVIKRGINASGGSYWNAYGRLNKLADEVEAQVVLKRVLKRTVPNMYGNDVRAVQKVLYKLGYNLGKAGIDGKYGKTTEAAVKLFQKLEDLTVDGKVGSNTAWALGLKFKV